ncbi:MAG TPA: hypothetical protein VMU92_02850 [Acidobacteriaceae bacterium]|nr:hypothetical protein [Acidobacteriaceae bacterium]
MQIRVGLDFARVKKAVASAAAVAVLGALPAFARSVSIKNATVTVTFNADGAYQVQCKGTQWVLRGTLGETPERVTRRSGTDALGAWHEVDARTATEVAGIRVYNGQPVVLFKDKRLADGKNADVFPVFKALPAGLMRFSYAVNTFAKFEFGKLGGEGPWVLYDAKGQTMVLSPADHFLVADMTDGPDGSEGVQAGGPNGVDAGGIDAKIATLPAGFEHGTLLVLGKGVNETLDAWGSALQAMNGKTAIANDRDVVLNKFGYWTDHFATYYYKYDKKLGYLGTLLAVRDKYKALGVPIEYMQLDSWWYPKGSGFSPDGTPVNGETVYRADKTIFPDGLKGFQKQMGLPFVVHARWVAPVSPYRHEYKMSKNVVLSPKFWNETAKYLKDGGVTVYEQDWLDDNARPAINLTDPQEFLGNMAKAMAREGITIQYCMPLPGYYMASTRYQNVETIRVSDDGFTRARWDYFLYDSALAHAVGLWPWSDVFMSGQEPELILDTLSAGPVGVGDALGEIDAANLKATMRADSVLLKPDVPVRPVDAMYRADAANADGPMVAATHSGDEVEVFAYPRAHPRKIATGEELETQSAVGETQGPVGETQVTVRLSELGITGPAYVWDWVRKTGTVVPKGGSFAMKFADGWAYDVAAPVGKDGIALLGDTGKYVPLAGKRFSAVTSGKATRVSVAFAAGESAVTVSGYAAKKPVVRAVRGEAGAVEYDGETGLFRVVVHPASGGGAVVVVR